MPKNFSFRLAILLLALAPSSSLATEIGTPSPWDLMTSPELLVDWVLQNDVMVSAAQANVDAASAQIKQAGVFQNPSFEFSMGNMPAGKTVSRGLGFNEVAYYEFSLEQTFEIGKRRPRISSAKAAKKASEIELVHTAAQRIHDVRKAIGRVLYFKEKAALLASQAAENQTILDLENQRLLLGDISPNDYSRLQLDSLELVTDARQATTDYQAALASCTALLGISCEIADSESPTLAKLLEHAPNLPTDVSTEHSRPDIALLGQLALVAEHEQRLASRNKIPDPSIFVGYTHDRFTIADNLSHTFSVGIFIPLTFANTGRHEAAAAGAKAIEQRALQRQLKREAEAEIAELNTQLAALTKTNALFSTEAVQQSTAVLEGTVKGFNQGTKSMTDLLLARRTHTNLGLKVIDIQYQIFVVTNQLRMALGLDAEIVQNR